MRKLTALLCAVLFFCTVFPVSVSAAPRYGSVTVTYSVGETPFPDIEVRAYRVADYAGFNYFDLSSKFSSYPIDIHNIKSQQEWKNLATTLMGYIHADNISTDWMVITDMAGVACAEYMAFGLYLIEGVTVQNGNTVYEFEPFFVYLPQEISTDEWDYDVEARPKYSYYIPQTEYSVVKLWRDSDNSNKRPQQVEVDIFKDGVLWQTRTLNTENSWKYSWTADADGSQWSVAEKNVPDRYSVSITENRGVFSIVNTYQPPEKPPETPPGVEVPDTGDNTSVGLYSTMMCISGMALLILGIYRSRRNNEED